MSDQGTTFDGRISWFNGRGMAWTNEKSLYLAAAIERARRMWGGPWTANKEQDEDDPYWTVREKCVQIAMSERLVGEVMSNYNKMPNINMDKIMEWSDKVWDLVMPPLVLCDEIHNS